MSTNDENNIVCDSQNQNDVTPATDYTVLVERLTGTVKWFNNRAGFGFITVCEPGEYENKEIFVHWSSIRVSNSQYKYLFQGEYVDFTLVKANNNGHEYQAMNVSGVKGGPIMCETRRTVNVGRRPPPRLRASGPPRNGGYPEDSRPPRRNLPPRRPRAPENGGGAAADSNGDNAESNLLGYVKVQSKRTRRGGAPNKAT